MGKGKRMGPPEVDVGADADSKQERTMPRVKWTEEEEKILHDLVLKDILPEMIGKVLGRTENSIRAKIKQLGLEVPTERNRIDYILLQQLLQPDEI